MFLSNNDLLDNFLSNYNRNLFNEAEGDAPAGETAGGDDLGAAPADAGVDAPTEETPTTENTGNMEDDTTNMEEESNPDEFQLGDEGGGEDPMGEENPDEAGGDDTVGEEDATGENDPESVKKLYLLNLYTDMYNTTNSLYANIQEYYDKVADFKYDNVNYILTHLEKFKNNLIFTISVKFKEFDYQKLITLYSYFEEELVRLTILVEKTINDDNQD